MDSIKISNSASRNEKLFARLKEIVMQNIENESFGVSELSDQIGISRSQLHRILKNHLQKSASQFIRDIRLEEALKLLMNDAGTVSEIAYKVGFSSPNYFSKCFNERYGFSPGETLNKYLKNELNDIIEEFIDYKHYDFNHNIHKPKTYFNHSTLRKASVIASFIIILFIFKQYLFNNQIESLAVLPLIFHSEEADSDLVASGFQESLIEDLGQLYPLKVISKTSTSKYSNSSKTEKEISKELDVEGILKGWMTEHADSITLTFKLIKTTPFQREIWTSDFSFLQDQMLVTQKTIVKEIAKELDINVSSALENKLTEKAHLDIDTYKSYVRGMYYINKSTNEDFDKGIALLHKAIGNDPANPLAYSGLAIGYAMIGHGPNPSVQVWKRGKAAALRAIKLDSTLAQAHTALACIKIYYEFDWVGAEKAFLRAIEINPNMAVAHFNYAWYLVLFNRYDEAIKEHKLAKELDPLTPIYTADLGTLYLWSGSYDKALIEAQQALELDPEFGHGWWVLGNVYVAKGMFNKAIEAHKRASKINPVWNWALGWTYGMSGNHIKANEILSQIDSINSPKVRFGRAFIDVTLGNLDEAFILLNEEPPDMWLPWIRTWPGFEPLREDIRYKDLMAKFNLSPI